MRTNLWIELALVTTSVVLMLIGIHMIQFAPHRYVVSLGTNILSDEVLTDPHYVTTDTVTNWTTHGAELVAVAKTNILWTQWNFWK